LALCATGEDLRVSLTPPVLCPARNAVKVQEAVASIEVEPFAGHPIRKPPHQGATEEPNRKTNWKQRRLIVQHVAKRKKPRAGARPDRYNEKAT
jgi:hypothetical protein